MHQPMSSTWSSSTIENHHLVMNSNNGSKGSCCAGPAYKYITYITQFHSQLPSYVGVLN